MKYKSVLILEDDPTTALIVKRILEVEGYVVFVAENGVEAFAKLDILNDAHRPCLILCDLQMPVMTGWEFVEKAGGANKVITIPIVIHSSDRITPPGFKALHKPVDRVSLLAIVREHCGTSPKDEHLTSSVSV